MSQVARAILAGGEGVSRALQAGTERTFQRQQQERGMQFQREQTQERRADVMSERYLNVVAQYGNAAMQARQAGNEQLAAQLESQRDEAVAQGLDGGIFRYLQRTPQWQANMATLPEEDRGDLDMTGLNGRAYMEQTPEDKNAIISTLVAMGTSQPTQDVNVQAAQQLAQSRQREQQIRSDMTAKALVTRELQDRGLLDVDTPSVGATTKESLTARLKGDVFEGIAKEALTGDAAKNFGDLAENLERYAKIDSNQAEADIDIMESLLSQLSDVKGEKQQKKIFQKITKEARQNGNLKNESPVFQLISDLYSETEKGVNWFGGSSKATRRVQQAAQSSL